MAKNCFMYKSLILLALIACHVILSVEGRQIKSIMNTKEANSAIRETARQGSSGNSHQNMSYKDDFRPTSHPGNRPDSDQEIVESKLAGDENSQKAGHFRSTGSVKDDFRPTAPGHSPGVGHALQN
ncbi:hypothetical protein Dsin_009559 [Dipteronia sinensis]|uniref:Uncharacterized protein n=1 Tax=Dipteronia sinensis TaxID=43782 RepID=A0AAE0EC17_9ROSI|nr:hypothetical protein Dsin_009559 [Dipteronia sinensis]